MKTMKSIAVSNNAPKPVPFRSLPDGSLFVHSADRRAVYLKATSVHGEAFAVVVNDPDESDGLGNPSYFDAKDWTVVPYYGTVTLTS